MFLILFRSILCPQHLLGTQILRPGHKNVSDFVQKHFVSATFVADTNFASGTQKCF